MLVALILDLLCDISSNDFVAHFDKLHNDSDSECNATNFEMVNASQCFNEEINKPFTMAEVKQQCMKLKNNKANGCDYILNEFIKYSPIQFISLITRYFNLILETGIIPDEWCMGVIQPIYKKKGSVSDPDNYRGITLLLSCMSKLFTALVNNRLST